MFFTKTFHVFTKTFSPLFYIIVFFVIVEVNKTWTSTACYVILRKYYKLLLQALNLQEYIHIEDKKRELFLKRIDFICMVKSLKIAMARESGYKQLKRYLITECGMNDADAQHNADKYDEGSRIYDKFSLIVDNCAQCPDIDIRDLTVKELALAVNLSWVIRRGALIKTKAKVVPADLLVQVDLASVQQSVDQILTSDWYAVAKDNPALVANIMNQISERVVSNSQYTSQHH